MGRVGAQSKYMGAYRRAEQRAHGYPLYSKEADGETHWLYRSGGGTGNWCVAPAEEHIAGNAGYINTKSAADLPTQEGVVWRYSDGGSWNDDSAMACTEVGGVGGSSRRHACAGRRRRR